MIRADSVFGFSDLTMERTGTNSALMNLQLENKLALVSGLTKGIGLAIATTEEVANLVAYVCSPLSSATNGAALRVDGGVVKSAF
jgi:hypothetical protein